MALLESGEMYLETIYVLSQKSSSVRGIDIADHLGYSKPSVSRAVGLLKDEGLVNFPYVLFPYHCNRAGHSSVNNMVFHVIISHFIKERLV